MRRARMLTAGAALAAVLTGTAPVAVPAGSTPARADSGPAPEAAIEFAASPDETAVGSPVVLSGTAGFLDRAGGNDGRVDFYFVKGQKGPRTHVGSTTSNSSGTFRWVTRATATGDYVAEYRHRGTPATATAADFLAVYQNRRADQMLYSWTASKLSCLPSCRAVGPEQFVGPGPIRVTLSRECLQPRSGGRIGFTSDPKNVHRPGAPGWRDFPNGEGPAEFDLKPGITKGHFYFEWTSAPAPDGELTSCNLSFTASQKSTRKEYL
ncbi:hypothetical protein [Actinoplanes sp. G11-F43]|uniref:hypothetical protein n=1 Tax=Actinoplanes sp. G11-F43 TaxID=3424130 RepID=UPI003D35230F